mgnify:CR=1 FL=1
MSGMRNVYPTKKDLNLAQKERSGHGLGPAALEALFLAVLVGLFCRFGVINVIAKAESAAIQAEDKLREMKSETSRFPEVREEYQSYTLAQSGMTGDTDPMECLDLIKSRLIDKAQVETYSIADGLISVQLSGVTLQEVSAIYADLMASDLVTGVQVYTASTTGGEERVTAALTIQLKSETAEEASR